MAETRERISMDGQSRSSLEKKTNIEHVEKAEGNTLAEEILSRYPLLVGKSEEEMAQLNKKVLKKLDWKFLVKLHLHDGELFHLLTSHIAVYYLYASHEVCAILHHERFDYTNDVI